MTDDQIRSDGESIRVRVEFAEDRGVPLSETIGALEDVHEAVDFAFFLAHGDARRWEHGGGRGQVRVDDLDHGKPVSVDLRLVMSGGLGLAYPQVHEGVSAVEAVLRTAGSNTAVPTVVTTDVAEKHVLEAMERVAYEARGTDLAWRIREAEEHRAPAPDGTPGKGARFVRAAARLVTKPAFSFRVDR
ncbi:MULTISPECIES: hypothetical protein [unclassified Curtobacterium]|uniref:hypothetical protein n=1 Tax=unclassified Curtobacterium TaxID=257496 RepID=UPI003818A924